MHQFFCTFLEKSFTMAGMALLLTILTAQISCRKAGLMDQSGSVRVVGLYRFLDENVDYLFFELNERDETLDHSAYYYAFDRGDGDFDPATPWTKLDLSTGVHLHQVVQCGEGMRCGSFSWPSNAERKRIRFRMLYHPEGTAQLEATASVIVEDQNLSAMIYGVYDSTNTRVQVRVEDNFGVPNRLNSSSYGMTRRFNVRSPEAKLVTSQAMKDLRAEQVGNYLFPAEFCTSSPNIDIAKDFSGDRAWLGQTFAANDQTNGACLTVDMVNKDGGKLATHTAYARRSPTFRTGSYRYSTPLLGATKIPIVLAYCSDAQAADQIRSADFFEYQRSIVGFEGAAEDLCFRIGGEASFRSSLTALLAAKLSAAKAASTTTQDFVFTVVLHQNLSSEFRAFHQIVAEEINSISVANENLVSPRLSGAFVYDSRSDFRPSSIQEKHMIWCPHDRPIDPSEREQIEQANCMVTKVKNLDLSVLNFVTPMGPFPTMGDYISYVDTYGERGLAKKPELTFASVPQNGSTFRESNSRYHVTYFDSEHLKVSATDRVRVCWENPEAYLLYTLRFREAQQSATTPGVDVTTAQAAWSIGSGIGDYRIGLAWEFPFVGRIEYKSALVGSVLSTIPFSRGFNTYQALGERRWLATNFDLGQLLQVCTAYCDHPYFDEAGTYQISVNYSDQHLTGCVQPRYPDVGAN